MPIFVAAKARKSKIIDLLLANGAKISNFAHVGTVVCSENIDIKSLFVSSSSMQPCIVRLFKAGAGLELLSFCCENDRPRMPDAGLSILLCQAVVLDGYRVRQSS